VIVRIPAGKRNSLVVKVDISWVRARLNNNSVAILRIINSGLDIVEIRSAVVINGYYFCL
jgi:hypothetical protein